MNKLNIKAEKDTLSVLCNPNEGIIELEGISYPQDAAAFFNPVFEWLDLYIEQIGKQLTMNLRINYLNTSSTKCLFDLIDRIEEYYQTGNIVQVNWYYEQDDEDIKETGFEFQEDMEIPFNLISY